MRDMNAPWGERLSLHAGLVVNGLRILDLASAKDRRVSIKGDVELDIASHRTDHDHHDDERSATVYRNRVVKCLLQK